jgi:KilA-N domain
MAKNRKIEVKGVVIGVSERNNDDFISLTDIAMGFDGGSTLIEKWLRNKNTLEYLAVWERLNNEFFNYPEFEGIKNEAGTNRFLMSVKQWIEKTKSIGIIASAGRYGGTYAHKDIAIEFCAWLSPEFKLLLIREFQRLKELEGEKENHEWNLKRILSKVNYRIHTEAIKDHLIPELNISKQKEGIVYADEAEVLNVALFGMTSKEWRLKNPELGLKGMNIRDYADLHQLTVLSNLESYNAIMIHKGIDKNTRLVELNATAVQQLKALQNMKSNTLDRLKSPNFNRLKNIDKENQ